MSITLWIVAVYVVGIFVIGLPMGKKSLKVWYQQPEAGSDSGGFWGYVLFPNCAAGREVGKGWSTLDVLPVVTIIDFENNHSKQLYIGFTGVVWPFRVLWNIFMTIVNGLSLFSRLLGRFVKV